MFDPCFACVHSTYIDLLGLSKAISNHFVYSCLIKQLNSSICPRGARGLGWNMSQALAEAGTEAIALLDLKQELGEQAAAELHETTGVPVQFYKVDVTDADSIPEVIKKVAEDFGSIDIVINSAGVVE